MLDRAGFLASLANKILLSAALPSEKQIAARDKLLVPISRILDRGRTTGAAFFNTGGRRCGGQSILRFAFSRKQSFAACRPCSAPGSGPSRRARLTVLLKAGGAQTGKTVALERPLPGEELLLGKLIAMQGFLHRDLAAAHGSDHRCFATDYPSLGVRRWQIGHWRYSQQRLRDDAIHRAPPG
jgi:hypothetical protein